MAKVFPVLLERVDSEAQSINGWISSQLRLPDASRHCHRRVLPPSGRANKGAAPIRGGHAPAKDRVPAIHRWPRRGENRASAPAGVECVPWLAEQVSVAPDRLSSGPRSASCASVSCNTEQTSSLRHKEI
jgi:hypothetical protein